MNVSRILGIIVCIFPHAIASREGRVLTLQLPSEREKFLASQSADYVVTQYNSVHTDKECRAAIGIHAAPIQRSFDPPAKDDCQRITKPFCRARDFRCPRRFGEQNRPYTMGILMDR
jgi:hypothetical protein